MNPITIAAALTCPDASLAIASAEQAAIEARYEDVDDAVTQTNQALSCGPAADPTLLARLWNAQGAALMLQGDNVSGAIAFRSAARAAPGEFDERYGSELRLAWQAAATQASAEGTLRSDDTVDGVLALDGATTELPATVPAGLHVVQALGDDGLAWHAEGIYLPAGEELTVHVPPRPLPEVTTTEAAQRRPFPTLLVAGGAGLVLGGASVVAALAQDGAMSDATDTDGLDSAYGRQKLFGYAAYPLLGLGAAGVTLYFVL